ncbi:MAG: hypothetical protein LUQ28_13995 [Methylococcaceae bacterium]|nr:hypothetical protein [Methylococcaceae bacterium]
MSIIELDHDVTAEELREMAKRELKARMRAELKARDKAKALKGFVPIKPEDFN